MITALRFGVALLLIAVALPFAATSPGGRGEQSCGHDEFWFQEKNCCLRNGGPSSHPEPPHEKKCPPHWSWSDEHACCTPHFHNPPPPRCENDWEWSSDELCCKPHNPHHPKPSGHSWKRTPEKRSSDLLLCPMGLTACPITSMSGPTTDFECLDVANELESCGGCASIGKGQDCTSLQGAWNVGCEQGSCAVYSCAAGFKLSRNGTSCAAI